MDAALDQVKELFTPEVDETVEEVVEEEINEEVIEDVEEEETSEEVPTEETDEVLTIKELAAAIEVDPEYLYGIQIGMGEGKDAVSLGSLKDSYLDSVKENDALKSRLEEQDGAMNNFNDMSAAGQNVSQELVLAFSEMDAIKKQFENTNWAEIEADDAGEAALLRQKFNEAFQQAEGKAQQAQSNQQHYQQQNMQRAATRTLELIPEWQDKAVRSADQQAIQTRMQEAGYAPEVIQSISDPIAISLIRKLVHLEAQAAGTAEAVQKVRKAPKALKVGGRKAPNTQKKTEALVKAAKTSNVGNRKKNELAAVKALMGM